MLTPGTADRTVRWRRFSSWTGGFNGAVHPLVLTGMSFSMWTMSPALASGIFWVAVVICAVAQLFILRAVFRTLPAPSSPDVPAPRRWAEIAWAILPMLGLVAVFLGAWRLLPS